MTLQDAVKAYIHKLETDSTIVSTSHYHYAAYAKRFGDDVWEKALDEYFENRRNQNKNYIIDQVNKGTATPEQQQWYNDWVKEGKKT